MKDPISSFEEIVDNFIRYVRTAFGIKFKSVDKERLDLLHSPCVLYQKPWIEPLPEYVSSNKWIKHKDETKDQISLKDLNLQESKQNNEILKRFKNIIQGGLVGDYPIYKHQLNMLTKAMGGFVKDGDKTKKKHCIITSGTGSGKTESFLLPLFAQLCKESITWSKPSQKTELSQNWWRGKVHRNQDHRRLLNDENLSLSNTALQRGHETRPAAVRAMILYPMNALVEDQMSRLRRAIDSDQKRIDIQENLEGNSFWVGRYNSNSGVPGSLYNEEGLNQKKLNRLKNYLEEKHNKQNSVRDYVDNILPKEESDLSKLQSKKIEYLSYAQRLTGNEMRSRQDMQVHPPDILITNYSMLSIMLMRQVDRNIFSKTREWLHDKSVDIEERTENRIFHLIIDELHLYRGTSGTEVSFLLKMVLNELGLSPTHPQLRILASSASLDEKNDETLKYLSDFFGIKPEQIEKDFYLEKGEKLVSNHKIEKKLNSLIFDEFHSQLDDKLDNKKEALKKLYENLCEEFKFPKVDELNPTNILEALISKESDMLLKSRLQAPFGIEQRAIATIEDIEKNFAKEVFKGESEQSKNAVKGLLKLRELFDQQGIKNDLPRFRFHYFIRNIEGLWAAVCPVEVEESYYSVDRTCGKLYDRPRLRSTNGNRVLELLYCDNCNTTLFGGSRITYIKNDYSQYIELICQSPDIEGIPEKHQAVRVEDREYRNFGVFWPIGNQTFRIHDDYGSRVPNDCTRPTTLLNGNQKDYSGYWKDAFLNKKSGQVHLIENIQDELEEYKNDNNSIRGRFYYILKDESSDIEVIQDVTVSHKAMPTSCPNCAIVHQKWQQDKPKRKTSSIRGFRTGFAKTNQILSTELFYQLEEKNRKLVVFSDSREDAAKIANDIQRRYFPDLIKQLIIHEFKKRLVPSYYLLKDLASGLQIDPLKYVENYSNLTENEKQIELFYFEDLIADYEKYVRYKDRRPDDHTVKRISLIRRKALSIRSLVEMIDKPAIESTLPKSFLEFGLNPGGNDVDVQYERRDNQITFWPDLFKSGNEIFSWQDGVDVTYKRKIRKSLYIETINALTGSLFYSLESSALGRIIINPLLKPQIGSFSVEESIELINNVIRIILGKYNHNKKRQESEYEPSFNSKKLENYFESLNLDNSITTQIEEYLEGNRIWNAREGGLRVEELFLRPAEKHDLIYWNPKIKQPHLSFVHNSCTSSNELLIDSGLTCAEFWNGKDQIQNYISYNAHILNRKPVRIHTEELTGQTDDQEIRQLHFRNIILPQSKDDYQNKFERKVKEIDILSVTTTLEVGVDIGDLKAIMLGNMPPQRFNYQQRVGRTGRRGQAFSMSLTFCRGRSHDEHYFHNIKSITGDDPPTPFLTLSEPDILKRIVNKFILRQAFNQTELLTESNKNVHGEFGKVNEWEGIAESIKTYLNQAKGECIEFINCILPFLPHNKFDIDKIITEVTTTNEELVKPNFLYNQICKIVESNLPTQDLSQRLAESGVLPLFGMPTSSRNMYHGYNSDTSKFKTIDRSAEVAIYEFAPGAEKTKDKAIHKSIGFTFPYAYINYRNEIKPYGENSDPFIRPESGDYYMQRCKTCGFFDCHENITGITEFCPNCGETEPNRYQVKDDDENIKIKIPAGYRTDLSIGRNENEDMKFFSRPSIQIKQGTDNKYGTKQNEPHNIISKHNKDDINWRLNLFNDDFLRGSIASFRQQFDGHEFRVNQQWIPNDYARNALNTDMDQVLDFRQEQAEECIVLGQYKKTEYIRIRPQSVNLNLHLNINNYNGAVRSAYFSAATLIQRLWAEQQDIDPIEIEIAELFTSKLEDGTNRLISEIILSDELANGSGFVRKLHENIAQFIESIFNNPTSTYLQNILSNKHKKDCKDSCYECLRIFRNMPYHGLLDWRLGLSYLRVLYDSNYSAAAYDGIFEDSELQGWTEHSTFLSKLLCNSFDELNLINDFNLPIIEQIQNDGLPKKRIYVVVHPLWWVDDLKVDSWLTESLAEIKMADNYKGYDIEFIDTFNLERRPGWCYKEIIMKD